MPFNSEDPTLDASTEVGQSPRQQDDFYNSAQAIGLKNSLSSPREDYSPAQDIGIRNFFPSQVDKDFRLEERQETTRSRLATFLINILAGTLTASFTLVIILIIMSGFVDDKKAPSFDKTSTLVKDLVTFILTAQTGLIGTALGFYFGSRGGNND
ncbi:MAG: hypothetical protein ACOYMP_06610 [Nodosilinea sp.]|nr:hypothetical protein [Cyanobacteria bacterium WB6_1B_304]